MSSPFVAEIRILPFNFAPTGWAFCDGQILPLSQNTALFSLLGTTYGGNGTSTFGLPNLQGCAPMQPGQGQGLSLYDLGETGGTSTVTLISTEMPMHTHSLGCLDGRIAGQVGTPGNATLALAGDSTNAYLPPPAPNGTNAQLSLNTLPVVGGNLPHENMMPYLTLNFCIALQGVFPPRG